MKFEPRHDKTCLRGRLKPACAATEARLRLKIYDIETGGIILSRQRTTNQSDCADAQADLRLCCLHMASTSFLMTRLIYEASL